MTTPAPPAAAPRRPAVDHDRAMALAATEYDRVATLLDGLTDEEWTRPTDCPGWDVRAMAGHMLGMMQMVSGVPEFVRQQIATVRRQRKAGGLSIDAMTAYQVARNAPFMHRIDISHATGREMQLTADHEGVIVDDVVREWAGRHRKPFRLELTGPAGGSWSAGGGEHITMDALEFTRVLSGRVPARDLLAQQVPF